MNKAGLLADLAGKPWFNKFVKPDAANLVKVGPADIELSLPKEGRTTTLPNGDNIYRVYFLEVKGNVARSRWLDMYVQNDGKPEEAAYYRDLVPAGELP